jgi:hypothetical protein
MSLPDSKDEAFLLMQGLLAKPSTDRRFQIIDLFAFTTIVALHFVAYRGATGSEVEWTELLCFSPTVITCILHLRLRLKTLAAMVVHYIVSLAWSFFHSIGQAALNNPYKPEEGITYQIDWYAYLWREMSGMAILGLAWATAYGLVCYTALHANRTTPSLRLNLEATDVG